MATVPSPLQRTRQPVPELHNGDRMTQPEFHRIYEQMPKHFKAELIGGIVHVASPLKRPHSNVHLALGTMLGTYEGNTPGVEAGDNATIILSDTGEPQPDLYLRILPDHGGQSSDTADGYIGGAPELIAEIADSSQAVDLKAKKDDYARHGVREYLVAAPKDQQLLWFDLQAGQELHLDADGICRVRAFPGLWIDAAALLAKNIKRTMTTLEQGLATPEHAAFVKKLAQARQ